MNTLSTSSDSVPTTHSDRVHAETYGEPPKNRREVGTMARLACQVIVALMGIPSPVLLADYAPGFTWNRYHDWTPGTVQGSSTGNPMPDAEGNAVWYCEYVLAGNPLGDSNPWYKASPSLLIWDANWWGTGIGVWAYGNDLNPCLGAYWLSHNTDPNLAFHGADMVRWRNPTQRTIVLDITGTIEFIWDGINGNGPTGGIDLIIARHNTNTDVYTTLLGQTVPKPVPGNGQCTTSLPVTVTGVAVGVDDELRLSLRGDPSQPDPRWFSIFDTNLTYTLVSFAASPEITGIRTENTNILIGISQLLVGGTYVIQTTPNLVSAVWSNAVGFTPTQPSATVSNPIDGAVQRFYRVRH